MHNTAKKIIKMLFKPITDKIHKNFSNIIQHNLTLQNIYITDILKKTITTYNLHKSTFEKYKGLHKDCDIAILGAGPSLNFFNPHCLPAPQETKFIGLNRACLFSKVRFDYLFAIDILGIACCKNEFFSYPDAVKFIGDQDLGKAHQIPETWIRGNNCCRYKTTTNMLEKASFTVDIDSQPLVNSVSVSIQAMQFALFTKPRRIFLVGIDTTPSGHFVGKDEDLTTRRDDIFQISKLAEADWNKMKDFIDIYYPDIEIISINPNRLRGLFKDIDTHKTITNNMQERERARESPSHIRLICPSFGLI